MTTDKKALIEKLIQDKHITLDEGLLLLETEKECIYTPAPYPVYPQYPGVWPYNQPWYMDGLRVICNTDSTTSVLLGSCATTNIVTSYPLGAVVSYTSILN